jgi:20S proteasome alpha/beta subunit
MTICIAALCYDQAESELKIVLCADKRVENDISGAETGHKVTPFKKGWWTLYSGVGVDAKELTWFYHSYLKDRTLDADVDQTLEILQEATNTFMVRQTDKLVRSLCKMSYHEFLDIGAQKLPHDIFEKVAYDIQRLKLNFSLVIGGFIQNSPELFVVEEEGRVRLGDEWEAIGSGSICAHAMLYFRGQTHKMSLVETLYHVFEAKAFSEKAGGVGPETEIYVLGKTRSYFFGNTEAYTSLRNQFSQFGPQKVSNPQYPVKGSKFSSFPNEP